MFLTRNTPVRLPMMSPILSSDLFDSADEVERYDVGRLFVADRFGFDEKIFEQGSGPACIWRLVSGVAALSKQTAAPDATLIVTTARPGNVFGLTETLTNSSFDSTLRAISHCVCERMDRDSLVRLLRDRPRIRNRVLEVISRRYLEAVDKLVTSVPCDVYHIPPSDRRIKLVGNSSRPGDQ